MRQIGSLGNTLRKGSKGDIVFASVHKNAACAAKQGVQAARLSRIFPYPEGQFMTPEASIH